VNVNEYEEKIDCKIKCMFALTKKAVWVGKKERMCIGKREQTIVKDFFSVAPQPLPGLGLLYYGFVIFYTHTVELLG
jgi:hypothetical protein